jgi:hypothetical protein
MIIEGIFSLVPARSSRVIESFPAFSNIWLLHTGKECTAPAKDAF